tara:strand:+ start:480 stop:1310 length:831 start_codon:yes stop_codon:yes gene_type:complete
MSRFIIINKYNDINTLIEAVAQHFGMTADDVIGRNKSQYHSSARFACYYVLNKLLKLSQSETGRHMKRDGGAVFHGVKAITGWADIDKEARKALKDCEMITNEWLATRRKVPNKNITINEQAMNNSEPAVNTKSGKTSSKSTEKLGSINSLFIADEKFTYIYKYNSKSSITFKLEKQLNNKDVFEAVIEYIKYRKQINKRLSQVGLDMQLKKLSKHNAAIVVEALEASIANGWQGVFPEKNNANNKSNNTKYNDKAKADYDQAVEHGSTETVGEVF